MNLVGRVGSWGVKGKSSWAQRHSLSLSLRINQSINHQTNHMTVGPSIQFWSAKEKSSVVLSSTVLPLYPPSAQNSLKVNWHWILRGGFNYIWTLNFNHYDCFSTTGFPSLVQRSWSRQHCVSSLTLQEVHVQVVPVDGDGVEALRGLHVHLWATGGPAAQQAGLSRSIQTQNQDLGPCWRHRPWLECTKVCVVFFYDDIKKWPRKRNVWIFLMSKKNK